MTCLICKNCNGFYKLKEGESVYDFLTCECGGELEYKPQLISKYKAKTSLGMAIARGLLIALITGVILFLFGKFVFYSPFLIAISVLIGGFYTSYIYKTSYKWGGLSAILMGIFAGIILFSIVFGLNFNQILPLGIKNDLFSNMMLFSAILGPFIFIPMLWGFIGGIIATSVKKFKKT
ncbi:hypothetical protein [Methanobacterium alcaliphilum]|uniref:hypothetical protein n=1 Tax=Methanobacterium alcaliphilum TaxID=392018 RepID=UPI00200A6F08|nr:hypothetical protein [Methanobacterium alcaliphilum]MCK9151551.1 hypothetical protein [Methanobacterium alcaliphilum]